MDLQPVGMRYQGIVHNIKEVLSGRHGDGAPGGSMPINHRLLLLNPLQQVRDGLLTMRDCLFPVHLVYSQKRFLQDLLD
jgi:hypothetical protein